MHTKTQSLIVTAGLIFGAALPVAAQQQWHPGDIGSLRVRLGVFEPTQSSSYWTEKFDVWTGEQDAFQDLTWGVDWLWMASPNWGLQIGTAGYEGSTVQAYHDFVDVSGFDISHRTEVTTWDLSVAWIFRPFRRSTVQPYVGVGAGFESWRLREAGDFIDFADPDFPILATVYQAEGTDFMAVGIAGVEIRTRSRWSVFLEGRWKEIDGDLGDDFQGLNQRLDLSGPELTAGFSWNF